ncbi:flavin reductase family protein [Streptomyces sp. enrichment culture]|uniref:flavin reductase family protein n=1 Tax=Streptomyces sp. enrichment culture TaxID=1795815 RepID=UPI003F556B50
MPNGIRRWSPEDSPVVSGPAGGARDSAFLRDVFGQFATGVTVITAMSPLGPVGMTANSFSSVSLDPPLILFSVSRKSRLCDPLTGSGSFAVNILTAEQRALSAQFASPGLDRFGDTDWARGATGCPVLPDVIAVLECRVVDVHRGGDHLITVGEVVDAVLRETGESPLVFFRGEYQELKRPAGRAGRGGS